MGKFWGIFVRGFREFWSTNFSWQVNGNYAGQREAHNHQGRISVRELVACVDLTGFFCTEVSHNNA